MNRLPALSRAAWRVRLSPARDRAGFLFAAQRLACFLLLCLAMVQAMGAESPPYALRWVSNSAPNLWKLEVTGASAQTLEELRRANWTTAQWQKALVVHAEQGDALGTVGMPAVLGSYRVDGSSICFVPQFPLEPGVKYVAALFPSRLPGPQQAGAVVSSVFELPRHERKPSTVVTQIYPTADVLPENLLKFYVHFSAPMRRGHIYENIHLRNEAGKDVELPFLEIDEELWNPELTRLTLFIDPGRIKRGVQPLEEIGPALEEGHRFTLIIDAQWKDDAGLPLKEGFKKSFHVGPPDREAVNPARWQVEKPKQSTRSPLVIRFGEPMDHALAQRVIHVVNDTSHAVAGAVSLRDQERQWSFTPANAWRAGAYSVLVQNTIEDISGNNIGKTFEVDLFEGVQRRFTNTTVRIPFHVR